MSPSDANGIRLPPSLHCSSGEPGTADTTSATAAAGATALLEQLAERSDLSPDDVRAIVTAATRLYANASAQAGRELTPVSPDVSTTDAITLACALLRSQDLTPFDMAMWFSRGARQD